MELEDKYENLLVEIHDSKDERFLKSEIPQIGKEEKREIQNLIEYLIEIKLVEFDKKDNAYYLTYEGYEKVEEIKEMIDVGNTMSNLEYEHLINRGRKNKIRIILLGIFLFIGGYFALNGIRVKNSLENGLDEEILKKIKEEVETKTDSILKEKQLDNKNQ